MPTNTRPAAGTNLSILVGTLTRAPEARTLPSGDTVLALELSVRPEGGPAAAVPVAWFDSPPAALEWPSGHELPVLGRVRRSFFRSGLGSASVRERGCQYLLVLGVPG